MSLWLTAVPPSSWDKGCPDEHHAGKVGAIDVGGRGRFHMSILVNDINVTLKKCSYHPVDFDK